MTAEVVGQRPGESHPQYMRRIGGSCQCRLCLEDAAELARLEAEAEAHDPPSSMSWRNTPPDKRPAVLADAATFRNGAERGREHYIGVLRDAGYTDPEIAEAIRPHGWTLDSAWRTLADVSDDPPGPLLLDMLEPAGQTLLYAAPGVGKGTTGAYLIVEAQRAGMRPVIFDAERRPREWARRVAGLGGDRSGVVYIEPTDLGPKRAGRPFWELAPDLRRMVADARGDLFLLDSILPASAIGEERLRSDAQSPFLFVAALDTLGVSALAFGHPPKGQPEGEPFGSMAWLAAFRLTWLGTKAEGDAHRVRWRPRKRNERGHISGLLLTFDYGTDGRPSAVERANDEESTRDWILAGLVHGSRSVGDMTEEMLAEIDSPPSGEAERIKERLGHALRRMAREGWVEKVGKRGPGVRWALAERP